MRIRSPRLSRLFLMGVLPVALVQLTWPDDYIHATDGAAVTTIRASLVSQIWSGGSYPTRLADGITTGVSAGSLQASSSLPNLASVDRYTVTTNGNTVQPWVLHPVISEDRLAVIPMGHLNSDTLSFSPHDTALVREALARGNAVLLVPMPSGGPSAHDTLGTHGTGSFHPMRYFLEPTIIGLNQYLDDYPGTSPIAAVGISGGGWTTVLLSALDMRIGRSIPIAGSLPLELRDPLVTNDFGDWEQQLTDLTHDGSTQLEYLDLYLMGASDGRPQTQVNNEFDPCCFYGTRHTSYATDLTAIESDWTFYLDSSHSSHGVGEAVLDTLVAVAFGSSVLTGSNGVCSQ